jgi:nitrile hydratase
MTRIHDLGGRRGFGPVQIEENEPVFHEPWERDVFGMALATGGLYNGDEFRHGIEKISPIEYLTTTYYEHWLETIEQNLLAHGVITREELEERRKLYAETPDAVLPERKDPTLVQRLKEVVKAGESTVREVEREPRFKVGERVVVRHVYPSGHTRLPGYVRGKRGIISRVYPAFVLPDTNAHLKGENPEHVYAVRFDARELWGESAEPNSQVSVDLWESYLEPR